MLICQAIVDETGAVKDDPGTHCFGNLGGDDRVRADSLKRDVLRSRFEAASIDGDVVKVYVSFRVFYQDTNGRCDVTVFPNLGVQQDEFGVDYVAPQEIYTDGGWIQGLRGSLRYDGTRNTNYRGVAFAMSVAVDEAGNASDGRVETNNFAFDESVQLAVDALEKQRFIPAIVNGGVRRARYLELMYVPEPPRRRRR